MQPRGASEGPVRRTLQFNILIAFATLLTVTVAVIVGYAYFSNSQAMLRLSDDVIRQVTDTVIERTTHYLQPAADMARLSAELPGLDSGKVVDNEQLDQWGQEVLARYPQLSGFYIGDRGGDFHFNKRMPDGSVATQRIDRSVSPATRTWSYRGLDGKVLRTELSTEFTYDPRARPWYKGANASANLHWTDVYIFFTDREPGISASFPIRDSSGDTAAVVGIDVALAQLSEFLGAQRIGESGVAFIVDESGKLIAYPGATLATVNGDAFRAATIDEIGVGPAKDAFAARAQSSRARLIVDSGGVRYIASFTPLPTEFGRSWLIGIVVPEADFLGAVERTNKVSLVIALTILVVAIGTSILVAKNISNPIARLTEETRRIRDLELHGESSVDSHISEVLELANSIASMKSGLRSFKRYVPDELVRELIETGKDAELGGHEQELTILFSDVVEFTRIAERIPANELMSQLSTYLGTLAGAVAYEGGTVDKYMGDGLMAFWGAPRPRNDHAERACRAALAGLELVDELNAHWGTVGQPAFRTRIGIHTGQSLVGNVGSSERMNYTVLGDSVNLASRLEGANTFYGTRIIVSEDTAIAATKAVCRPLDRVRVKGRTSGVMVYELVGIAGEVEPELADFAKRFGVNVEHYLASRWAEALTGFEALRPIRPDDLPTRMYIERCQRLLKDAPVGWVPLVELDKRKTVAA